jgi:zona occludens toxin
MIYCITGTPGHGKTQRGLWMMRNDARFKGRRIYWANVRGLNVADERLKDWSQLEDVTKWKELPAGSVVFIDECHMKGFFPLRGTTAPPQWIEDLATHRHLGLDFVLITQNAKNIDPFVRRLVELHIHCKRPAQMGYTNVYEFQGVTDCDATIPTASALRHERWQFDKTIWTLYTSADEHTAKARLPRLLFLFPILGVLLIGSIYVGHNWFSDMQKKTGADPTKPADQNFKHTNLSPAIKEESKSVATMSPLERVTYQMNETRQWHFDRIARDNSYPESAPIYDEVRELKTFPRVTACAVKQTDCRCYNQQGIQERQVPLAACLDFVLVGRFDPYRDEEKERDDERRGAQRRDASSSTSKSTTQQSYLVTGLSGHTWTETRESGYSATAGDTWSTASRQSVSDVGKRTNSLPNSGAAGEVPAQSTK